MKLFDPKAPMVMFTDRGRRSYEVIGNLFRLTLGMAGVLVDDLETPESDEKRAAIAKELVNHIIFHNTIGPQFNPIMGAYNIALPAHEWSLYPKAWVNRLNNFDEVWVTSDHVMSALKNSGVKAPILFMPPALDSGPHLEKSDWSVTKPFRFLSVGEAHFRKGFHLLMAGFDLAFPDEGEATLTIKTSKECNWRSPRPDIEIIADDMEPHQIKSLYSGVDAYVSASLAEGLGLPIAEAVMALTPVATNYWGGHKSLLKKGRFWEIGHEEIIEPFASDPTWFAPGQKCAYSSPEQIAATLREVATAKPHEREKRSRLAQSYLRENYGSDACVKRMKGRVEC